MCLMTFHIGKSCDGNVSNLLILNLKTVCMQYMVYEQHEYFQDAKDPSYYYSKMHTKLPYMVKSMWTPTNILASRLLHCQKRVQ